MERRKFGLQDQLRGVKAAIRSPRTPPQLKNGLTRRAEELEKKIKANSQASRRQKSDGGILEILGL